MYMRYRCIKEWNRHRVGDVIERYEYNRIPGELRSRCFVLIDESTIVEAPVPVTLTQVTQHAETVSEPVEPVEPVRVESNVDLAVHADDVDIQPFERRFKKKIIE